jgi:hypothetical protein
MEELRIIQARGRVVKRYLKMARGLPGLIREHDGAIGALHGNEKLVDGHGSVDCNLRAKGRCVEG